MWRIRRATACTASLRKWFAAEQKSVNRETKRLFSKGICADNAARNTVTRNTPIFEYSTSRGFATRAKRAPADSASEDASESDEFESEAESLKDLDETVVDSAESEEDDLDDDMEATSVDIPTKKPVAKTNRTDTAVKPLRKREDMIQSDKLEQELWRRFCALKRDDDVVPVLEQWKDEGKEISPKIIVAVIERMKGSSRFTHGLQVCLQFMEWVVKQPEYEDFKLVNALLIELTARAKGIAAAEKVFEDLPEEEKNKAVYQSLLSRYVYVQNVKKAEQLFERMEKAGYVAESPYALNLMMKLYKAKDDTAKFQQMLEKAKEVSVEPNIFTYNVMLDLKGRKGDIEGLEKIFNEIRTSSTISPDALTHVAMIRAYLAAGLRDKAEVYCLRFEIGTFRKSKANYEFLMTAYGQLGLPADVERMWQKCKTIPGNGFNSFLILHKSMALAGNVEKAEQMFKYMESWKRSSAFDTKRHNNLLMAYYKKGMKAEAKAQEKKMEEAGIKVIISERDKQPLGTAVKGVEKGTDKVKRDREKEIELKKALSEAAEKGDIKAAEKAFESCKRANLNKVGVWNRLLKAYVNAEVPAYGFLQRMKADKVEANEETEALLKELKEIETKGKEERAKESDEEEMLV